MSYEHDHDHDHERDDRRSLRALSWAFGITVSFFVLELLGGLWTRSLALVADSLHMGVDVVALGISLVAARVSLRRPDAKRTFGYKRVEVIAAFGNGVALLVATGAILNEAIGRWNAAGHILAGPMLAVAVAGLGANVACGAILYRSGDRENLNLRAALLHVASDAMGSVAAIGSGVVILWTGWQRADSLASGLICVGILANSVWLIRDSVHILLEGAPTHLELEEVRSALTALPGVRGVHDLHLWSLSKGSESMSGHLVIDPSLETRGVLRLAKAMLLERFKLSHVTLQVEDSHDPEGHPCSE